MPSQKLHDPWAKREAWRNAPHFSPRYSLRHAWPGLSWGIGAFIIYLGIDAVNNYYHLVFYYLNRNICIKIGDI
ncbi:unnamed protein product [Rhizophagus irregularis]|uniref:Uncharacterized protein n=1 Tax=Rhizophagus irregularis TaxID=588596 RepID=A0A915YT90_9GLOM|nr:unnamed protein product [Rhizophagus irregularis]CAB5206436.1 unnamed protein product [Rhizophagus irregularis]CAB5333682.1 unnamed protein product [Rhizophagus irregularis]